MCFYLLCLIIIITTIVVFLIEGKTEQVKAHEMRQRKNWKVTIIINKGSQLYINKLINKITMHIIICTITL